MNRVLFSGMSPHWPTPEKVYAELDQEFRFDFDPCPLGLLNDGLVIDWGDSNFVNPPYGRGLIHWLEKGFAENRKGKTVVFLLPSRTDTKWFHEYGLKADEIRFIKSRLKFGSAVNNAPFPSLVLVLAGINCKKRDHK